MSKKVWMWVLAGWLLSLVITPGSVLGMFKAKKA